MSLPLNYLQGKRRACFINNTAGIGPCFNNSLDSLLRLWVNGLWRNTVVFIITCPSAAGLSFAFMYSRPTIVPGEFQNFPSCQLICCPATGLLSGQPTGCHSDAWQHWSGAVVLVSSERTAEKVSSPSTHLHTLTHISEKSRKVRNLGSASTLWSYDKDQVDVWA